MQSRKKRRSSVQESPATDRASAISNQFPIVGVGASAGGLEAFKQFLKSLPVDTGMAFVLVQHLDPKHESMSAGILSHSTPMPVAEIQDGTRVERDHVYVIPSNADMGIIQGVLKLFPREVRGTQRVIDRFFQSLAADQKMHAIGIVLSGTASDGTEGLASIKAEGGITLAQDPKSARFPEMPASAIAAGVVDLVLPPERIAEDLARIAHHPFGAAILRPKGSIDSTQEQPSHLPESKDSLSRVFLLLRDQCHMDFTFYKTSTILRRIERRMVLLRIEELNKYSEFLSKNPDEVKALYRDILIHVTSFFRDPKAFEALKEEVFPRLMKGRPARTPIRVWTPGCSSGEEPYSIAMSLLEFLGDRASDNPIQIFSSDISEDAIQRARSGVYPETIRSDVSAERLERFFTRIPGEGYKISKSIRDLCLFSRHDVTSDPPFAKIDLISCRNLLIYFSATLQKHVIPIFHYALNPRGILWLGESETVGGFANLFSVLDNTHKIYVRKDARFAANLQFPGNTYTPREQEESRKHPEFPKPVADLQRVADLALQGEFPGVLVNEEMDILQYRGEMGPFIQPAPGAASNHLMKMVRTELIPELRMAIRTAEKKNTPVTKRNLTLKQGRTVRNFNLRVIPVQSSDAAKQRYFLILFEDLKESAASREKGTQGKKTRNVGDVAKLRRELASSLAYQNDLIEKYEATQESLTAANEELQSSNEELQSTNEELETAKEELQSSNEELTTVNDELQSRSIDQIQLSNDLNNLLSSVEIAIVMLSSDRKIRRYTPLAGRALNLIPSDVGRPLSDLKLNFTAPETDLNLSRLVTDVLETISPREVEVRDAEGRWFRLQIRPYKTLDNRIDGVVLSLIDIDSLKRSLKEIQAAKLEAQAANRSKDLFLATLSHELRTPLTAILSWAQMIKSGKLDPDKLTKGINIIEESAKVQNQLISDLLDVSRVVAGKVSLDFHEVNLYEVIQSAVESIAPAAKPKSIDIDVMRGPGVGTVMADRTRLQ